MEEKVPVFCDFCRVYFHSSNRFHMFLSSVASMQILVGIFVSAWWYPEDGMIYVKEMFPQPGLQIFSQNSLVQFKIYHK